MPQFKRQPKPKSSAGLANTRITRPRACGRRVPSRADGFGVLEWWKSQRRSQELTIIVLTGSGLRDDVARAYKGGASLHLTKPAKLPEVTELAQRALDFWRQNQGA